MVKLPVCKVPPQEAPQQHTPLRVTGQSKNPGSHRKGPIDLTSFPACISQFGIKDHWQQISSTKSGSETVSTRLVSQIPILVNTAFSRGKQTNKTQKASAEEQTPEPASPLISAQWFKWHSQLCLPMSSLWNWSSLASTCFSEQAILSTGWHSHVPVKRPLVSQNCLHLAIS